MTSNAELAILSLIAEEPRHGYQIEQLISERNMRTWTEIGFSSIYRLLKKFEKEGLIIGEPGEPEGRGPARVIYSSATLALSTSAKVWVPSSTPWASSLPGLRVHRTRNS